MTARFFSATHVGSAVLLFAAGEAAGQINTVQMVAPGIYLHEGDPRRGHSNNGWIVSRITCS